MDEKRRVPAIAGAILGNLVDGYGVVAVAFVGKAIERVWDLSPAMLGLVFASGPAGMMLGSFLISPLADRFGRRKVAIASMALVALGMFAAAASTEVNQLLAMLLVTGFGIGGVLATLNTLVAELAPPGRRNTVMAIFSAGYPLGSTLAGGFALGLMASYGWPVVFVLGGVLATLAVIINLVTLPETAPAAGAVMAENRAAPHGSLFGAQQRGQTIAICLAFFFNMLTFYFILLWTARLTSGLGLPDDAGARAMTIVNLGSLIGPLFFGFLADRLGLVRMAGLYFVLFAVFVALFAPAGVALWALYAISALTGLAMAGAMTSLYAMTPLLFVPQVRAAGTGLAIGVGRLGATLGPILAGVALQAGIARPGLYMLFAIPPILVATLMLAGRVRPAATLAPQGA